MRFLLNNQWILTVGILLLCGVFVTWFIKAVKKRLLPRLSQTPFVWDDALLEALVPGLLFLTWGLISLFLVVTIIAAYTTLDVHDVHIIQAFIWGVAVLWFALSFVNHFQVRLRQRIEAGLSKTDLTTVSALSQLVRICLVVVIVLVFMQTMGISISALLAFGGIGGIALGFAAKDSLANFLGGLMIFMDRPFSVGDWISSPDRKIEGTVDHIGWRLTRIITFDKRPLYVPNGVFSVISLENPSRMTNRRIKTQIGLRYEDAGKIKIILSDIEAMLKSHPDIATDRTLMVNLIAFADSSLNFLVYTFTKTTHWQTFQSIQQDVFLKIIEIVHKHGADFAFPTQTLDVPGHISFTTNQKEN